MNFAKIEQIKAIGIFEKDNNEQKLEIVSAASEYWAEQIRDAGDNQLNVQLENNFIEVSEKDLERFKKVFVKFISSRFSDDRCGLMLWTANAEYFERIGTDAYIKEIMKKSKLPLTILPADLCMFIKSDSIVVLSDEEEKIIYQVENKRKTK